MFVQVQPSLPGTSPQAVSGELTIHVSSSGQALIGWEIHDTASDEPRAIGCNSPGSLQDGAAEARIVLEELLRALPTLVDAPPFD